MQDRQLFIERMTELAIDHHELPGLSSGALLAATHLRRGDIDQAIYALRRSRHPAMVRMAWTIETELASFPEQPHGDLAPA